MSNIVFTPAVIRPLSEAESRTNRKFQGIPGIERMPDGSLYVVFYANSEPGEGLGNYIVIARSTDGGLTWQEESCIVPPEGQRTFDPAIWRSPDNELFLFFAQSHTTKLWEIFDGTGGVWYTKLLNRDNDTPAWSAPVRIGDGIMMNKPTVLNDGSWALPIALWIVFPEKIPAELTSAVGPHMYITRDGCKTFTKIPGPAHIPDRSFDEHVIMQRSDDSLMIAVRTRHSGALASVSKDGGKTWGEVFSPFSGGADSRFALRKLKSGRWCLITHAVPKAQPGEKWTPPRTDLAVWLSEDEGNTWTGRLYLDRRTGISYPDLTEGDDGFIYVTYDWERTKHGQILVARLTEQDILAGDIVTPGSFTSMVAAAF